MKTKILCLLVLVSLFTSCRNNSESNQYEDEDYYAEEEYYSEYEREINDNNGQEYYPEEEYYSEYKRETANNGEDLKEDKGWFSRLTSKRTGYKTHELRDARTGLVVSTTKFPSDWNIISKPVYTIDQKVPNFLIQVEGPNNLKSFNTPTKLYLNYQDPQVNQMVRYGNPELGKMLRPEVSSVQLVEQEVKQRMAQSGFTYVGKRQIPKLEAYATNQLNANGGQGAQMELYTTQWKNNTGQSAIATVTKIAMVQPMGSMTFKIWTYTLDYIFADDHALEDAIDTMVNATVESTENPKWEQYMSQLAQQRQRESVAQMKRSNAAHRQNMASRQAAFDAHQQKMKGIWAAQDANHASFMNRNFGAGSDVGQKQFVNMINEQETVYNPLTNKNYQVNAGSTEYWMDSNGNYIQNNDLFYTPNGDINLNNRDWVKVKKAF